jgi:ABC-2 type transport system permease protein
MTARRSREFTGALAILVREVRSRMRGPRPFVFLTFYLAVLGGLLWIGLLGAADRQLGALEAAGVGRGIFAAIILIETLVVLILAPAYTGASISQEREKQTFDLLAVTPVSSLAIVVGKLVSALSFLAIVVGASMPLASLAFVFGGVGVADLLIAYAVIISVAVGAGALGVACSAIFRRTQPATVAAFVAVTLTAGGSTVAWLGMQSRASADNTPPPSEAFLYPNPFVAQADLLCAAGGGGCFATPVQAREVNAGAAAEPQDQGVAEPGSLWIRTVVAWLVVAVAAVLVAAHNVSPTRRLWEPRQLPALRARTTDQ